MDALPDTIDALRAALFEARGRAALAEADAAQARAERSGDQALIATLKLQIEKLQRDLYGRRSERSSRLLDQLEFQLEEAEASVGEDDLAAEQVAEATGAARITRKAPSRKPFPAHLPRERVVIPAPAVCPCCGSPRLCKLGESVTETAERIPARWTIIQTVREKFSCRDCETISQPPAPFHTTPRGWAGPNLLATLLFEKFGQHQPLNRQCERFAKEGMEISLSTAADQVGAACGVLKPLLDRLETHVLAAERLHGDDTTVPVLAKGKTDTGRIWVYVRDDRPFAGAAAPAALFHYSRDRGGGHPEAHLDGWTGVLQADAYAGYNRLYDASRRPQPVAEALCWAHARRKFFELADIAANKRRGKGAPPISPLALEAVRRIDPLFDIEREALGRSAADRLAVRTELSRPRVEELETWMRAARAGMSKHAPVAKAMDYMLTRWAGFTRFLRDGRVCLTTDDVENLQLGIGPMWSVQSTDRMLAKRRMTHPGSRPQPRVSAGPRSGRLDAGGVIRQVPMVAPSRLPPSAHRRVRRARHTPPRVAGSP